MSCSWVWVSCLPTIATSCQCSNCSYRLCLGPVTPSRHGQYFGIVPNVEKLGDECNVSLAASLHAPNDALRNELVPINKLHPIAEFLDACWRYAAKHANRFITFEYVMLRGVNDSAACG